MVCINIKKFNQYFALYDNIAFGTLQIIMKDKGNLIIKIIIY